MTGGPSELGVIMRPGMLMRRKAPPRQPEAAQAPGEAPARSAAVRTTVFLTGLRVEAEVGVFAHERGLRRPLDIDMAVTLDPAVRAADDKLAETVDYDMLAAAARAVVADAHIHLVETVAEQIADRLLADPRVIAVKVRVEKPGAVAGAKVAGVEIERAR
jgi:7,8-dihydroneopterin aldolase/epimerase/oxygenase